MRLRFVVFFATVFVGLLPVGLSPPLWAQTIVDPDIEALAADSNLGRRDALEAILSDLGVPYETEAFAIPPRPGYPRTEGANLIVTLGSGAGDIVVGAHYDAVWLSEGVLSRGAVDNGASALILARLATRLGKTSLNHRVRIVFFDMEEIGLQGSRAYVSAYGPQTRAAVNLDVNGYGDTVFYGPSAAPGNTELYDLMRDHCLEDGIRCVEFPQYPTSDHLSFQRAGIPNISLSILPESETGELRAYANPPQGGRTEESVPRVLAMIHSPADIPEQVEPSAIELGVRSLEAYVRLLDRTLE
jgi:aminopeptidase S